MNGPYQIKNLENKRENIGTIESHWISLCNFAGKFASYDENVVLFDEITNL